MTAPSDLASALDAMQGARVVCVGDVMLDRFVYGEVTRVSPEAPIPVCRVMRETAMLGGAGNVVRNLVAIGAAADFVSVTGADAAREEVTALLGALDGVAAFLAADAGRTTTVKTRFIAGGQQLLRADREQAHPLPAPLADEVVDRVAPLLDRAGALVLSDYGKGVLSGGLAARLIQMAKARGVPVLVDPKASDYAVYRGADLATPNRRELAEAARMPADGDDAVVEAAQRVIAASGIAALLVTRGAEGMTLVSPSAAAHLEAEAREVFDVSGAGDTVVAAMAAARAAGVADLDAAAIANIAAGIVVGRVGTAVAGTDDIRAALRARERRLGETKIVSLDAALSRIERWRANALRIGFTNGVFDLLHPGHVSLIAQARKACDRLVVGLNADDSVRRLKGESRPVQGAEARAAVLASLADVDLVLVFGEDTPMRLIEAIRPDVLVKGADYAPDQVVGAPFVQSYGGRVLLAEIAPGHSTTSTIAKLAR